MVGANVYRRPAREADGHRLELIELRGHELGRALLARTEDKRDRILIEYAVTRQPSEHLPTLDLGRIGSKGYRVAGLANLDAILMRDKLVHALPDAFEREELVIARRANLAAVGQLHAIDLSLADLCDVGRAMGAQTAVILLGVNVGRDEYALAALLPLEKVFDRSQAVGCADARLRREARGVVDKHVLRAVMHLQAVRNEVLRMGLGQVENVGDSGRIQRQEVVGKRFPRCAGSGEQRAEVNLTLGRIVNAKRDGKLAVRRFRLNCK